MTASEDDIVQEMDVYFCNKGLDAQLYVLQYPLRPAWRPYETEQADQIRFKPKAKRMEFDLALDPSYQDSEASAENQRKTKYMKLASSEVDLKSTSHAAGFFQDNCLFLTPVEGVLHLRPDLHHLDPVVEEREENKTKELTPLHVTVKKGETLAEQQRRENSYLHLMKKDQLEAWNNLTPVASTSRVAGRVLDHLTMKIDKWAVHIQFQDFYALCGTFRQVDMSVPKEQLLSIVAPKIRSEEHNEKQDLSPLFHHQEQDDEKQAKLTEAQPEEVQTERLTVALNALFQNHGVANLKDIRHWLREFAEDNTFQSFAVMEDDILHEWIMKSQNVAYIRRVYMREAIGSAQLDPLRHVVMEIIRHQETVRRNDVISAAKAKGIRITEKLFDTVMREICISKEGGFWMLKTGNTD